MNIEKEYQQTWTTHGIIEACFIENEKNFAKNKYRGADYIERYGFLNHPVVVRNHFFTPEIEEFKKFKNSKILVIGGGPTTNEIDWNPKDYDFIFSCNHFFLNEKIKNIKVDLCFICSEVNILSQPFLEYLTKFKTYVGFEDYYDPAFEVDRLNSIIYNKVFCCISRFQGRIGVGPKLALFAAHLEASEIHMVGIDGVPSNYQKGQCSKHSFQSNKKFQTNYPYDLILNHYAQFKRFFYEDLGKNIIIKNLGEGHEYNCLSKI